MKQIIFLVLIIAVISPTFGQKSQSLDSLSRKEIRNLILNQNSLAPEAGEMMEKHKNSRLASYTFLAITAIVITAGIANRQDTRSGRAVNTGLTISGSLLALIPAGITGLAAQSRYKKAKRLYINKLEAQNFN